MADYKVDPKRNPIIPIKSEVRSHPRIPDSFLANGEGVAKYTSTRVVPGFKPDGSDFVDDDTFLKAVARILHEGRQMEKADQAVSAASGNKIALDYPLTGDSSKPWGPVVVGEAIAKGLSLIHQGPMNLALRDKALEDATKAGVARAAEKGEKAPRAGRNIGGDI